jgi:glutamine phosphoribosylpyrophosphate amidotransferase
MKFNPPKDSEIIAHLVQRSDDTEEKVHSNVAAVKGNYLCGYRHRGGRFQEVRGRFGYDHEVY